MTEQLTATKISKLSETSKIAQKSLSDFLKFIDDLPDPAKSEGTVFPYGSDQAKPYGWFLK